ncbi:MAG TPA: ABC transporter permease [Thermoanaerobaculia bacterium]|jgi:putative ABC transport system permease protein
MDLFWKDIRFALHSLRTHPGFAIVAILTLALGIGATTAIFSVVNGVLLQPLPLHDPDRLVMVWEKRLNEADAEPNVVAPRNYTEWKKQSTKLFSSSATSFDWELSMTGQNDPALVRTGLVSAAFFPTLGVKPMLGTTFDSDDDQSIVLSHAFWQSKFGGDPRAIGRTVTVDGDAYTITGVMPRDFIVPRSRAEMWVPYVVPPDARGRYLSVIARLKPGVSVEQAQAGMSAISQRLTKVYPDGNTNYGSIVIPVHEQVVGNVRRVLIVVMAAVGLLLLIACVNIANLLLSRATGRAREMAVRAALGASRGQLIRQMLTESMVLATLAGIVGVVFAGWATMLLLRFTPESAMLPRTAEIGVDARVLAITALLTVVTGIIFGLAPALAASRPDLQTGLKSSGRGTSQDRRGKRFRNALVVAEVALATVLLIGAGLLIKSFAKLESVESGVRPEGVLTMRVVLPAAYNEPPARKAMVERIIEQVDAVPGVDRLGAIVSINMPFTNSWSNTSFAIEGDPIAKEGEEPSADIRPIAGDYFRSMGMALLSGRTLNPKATTPKRTEFVVNEAFARQYFQGRNVLGRRLVFEWFQDLNGEIVGVVGNVRAQGLNVEPAPAIYFSYELDVNNQFTLAIASSRDPKSLQVPVARVLSKLDPNMPVSNVATLEDLISGTIARPRFNATMLSLFAALGLLLAAIGIYGVLSYSVAQRTHEMGIRMALGADPGGVLRLVVRDGVQVAVIGVAIGLLIALPAARTLAALLYGVEATDVTVFAAVALTLTAIALAASYIPARRATRVDPMIALRPE